MAACSLPLEAFATLRYLQNSLTSNLFHCTTRDGFQPKTVVILGQRAFQSLPKDGKIEIRDNQFVCKSADALYILNISLDPDYTSSKIALSDLRVILTTAPSVPCKSLKETIDILANPDSIIHRHASGSIYQPSGENDTPHYLLGPIFHAVSRRQHFFKKQICTGLLIVPFDFDHPAIQHDVRFNSNCILQFVSARERPIVFCKVGNAEGYFMVLTCQMAGLANDKRIHLFQK